MARTTKVSRQIASAAKRTRKVLRKAALEDICVGMHDPSVQNRNKLPYRYVSKMLKELKPCTDLTWITRNIINKAFLSCKEKLRKGRDTALVPSNIQTTGITNGSILSDISGTHGVHERVELETNSDSASCAAKSKGGRPSGTTNALKQSMQLLIIEAKNEIAEIFAASQKKEKKRWTYCKRNLGEYN